jgi:proteic killer suppression protein
MPFDLRFKEDSLEELQEEDAKRDGAYPAGIARAYRKRIQVIRDALDERDFYALGAVRFEKLQGNRGHQHSMRLNDQWRLILEIQGDSPNKTVLVVAIEDYH